VIHADGNRYFLKVYHRLGHVVHQIKRAESFFADRGIPVLLPLRDVHGREAFCLERIWCSLFLYVDGCAFRSAELTQTHLESMGQMMANIHIHGAQADHSMFEPIHFWQHEHFFWEEHELVDTIQSKVHLRDIDRLVLNILEQKKKLIEGFTIETIHVPRSHPVLIHGDFIYQNIFWNENGKIAHMYDFEKTCIAPRAYECARSLMINCFDEGWGDEPFARARVFLQSYRERTPFSFEEFLCGMRMYWMNVAHMVWIEAKHVYASDEIPSDVFQSHANRVAHLHEDPKAFCERIYYQTI
jgi:Ser/Thr protein kinase RdoA (MazF antagonist)